jgi:bacteriorhodopsin
MLFKPIDTFSILDQVTLTERVSYSQVITWQLTIFGTFVVVIATLFVYMNNRFDTLTKQVTDVQIGIAEIKAVMSMTKAIELGTTQVEILKSASQEANNIIQPKSE